MSSPDADIPQEDGQGKGQGKRRGKGGKGVSQGKATKGGGPFNTGGGFTIGGKAAGKTSGKGVKFEGTRDEVRLVRRLDDQVDRYMARKGCGGKGDRGDNARRRREPRGQRQPDMGSSGNWGWHGRSQGLRETDIPKPPEPVEETPEMIERRETELKQMGVRDQLRSAATAEELRTAVAAAQALGMRHEASLGNKKLVAMGEAPANVEAEQPTQASTETADAATKSPDPPPGTAPEEQPEMPSVDNAEGKQGADEKEETSPEAPTPSPAETGEAKA